MNHIVLISGNLDQARLGRVLGALANLGSLSEDERNPVIVIESDGGTIPALRAFLDRVFDDPRTRTVVERAVVKIYNAQSAAAVIALSFGCRREMAATSCLGFHLPLVTVGYGSVDHDGALGSMHREDIDWAERNLADEAVRNGRASANFQTA